MSPWSSPSACESSCGEPQMIRRRFVLSRPSADVLCPPSMQVDQCSFNLPPCRHECGYAPWTEWSTCSSPCEGGTRVRARIAYNTSTSSTAACAPELDHESCESSTPCKSPPHGDMSQACVLSNWVDLSPCSDCGGFKVQTPQILTLAYGHNAPTCTAALTRTVQCPSTLPCQPDAIVPPVHHPGCKYSVFGEWGACTSTCGEGSQVRNRKVIHQTAGNVCNDSLVELRLAALCRNLCLHQCDIVILLGTVWHRSGGHGAVCANVTWS